MEPVTVFFSALVTLSNEALFSVLRFDELVLRSLATLFVLSLHSWVAGAALDFARQLQLDVFLFVRVELHLERVYQVVSNLYEVWIGETNVASTTSIKSVPATC